MTVEILIGDCRERLREMPGASIHTCVTSPPYFGLRDYGNEEQIGLEETPDAYVAQLVEVFREVRRVLRDDGTLWVNLGDSYNAGTTKPSGASKTADVGGWTTRSGDAAGARRTKSDALKVKDLMGIPWRVAFALQADGWYLRQEIIWSKPNPMPESVQDRCTKTHEQIFLLTKAPRYYFDAEAIKEPMAESSLPRLRQNIEGQVGTVRANGGAKTNGNFKAAGDAESGMRNKRTVWEVTTQPFSEAHFATYPPKLIEPCILAGAPLRCCAACGAPYERQVERTAMVIDRSSRTHDKGRSRSSGTMVSPASAITTGWAASCRCEAPTSPGRVLDPFGGAGTTGLVADSLGRDATLIELNPDYAAIASRRLKAGMTEVLTAVDDQRGLTPLPLFGGA